MLREKFQNLAESHSKYAFLYFMQYQLYFKKLSSNSAPIGCDGCYDLKSWYVQIYVERGQRLHPISMKLDDRSI